MYENFLKLLCIFNVSFKCEQSQAGPESLPT